VLIDEKKGKKLDVCPMVVESVLNAESEILEKFPRLVDTDEIPPCKTENVDTDVIKREEILEKIVRLSVERFEPVILENVERPV
jgi:hypothetical protein